MARAVVVTRYKNALGSFLDAHTLKLVDKRKRESTVTTRRVLIAVGGRPTPLPCEGGNLAIDSDDIFTLDHDPGKTLVIGASYVALECAGFLTGTGHDTTVMVRSIFLRGFDQSIANMIAANMQDHGTKFIKPATPSKIERQEDGKLKVTWTQGGAEHSDVFDTVFSAVGTSSARCFFAYLGVLTVCCVRSYCGYQGPELGSRGRGSCEERQDPLRERANQRAQHLRRG